MGMLYLLPKNAALNPEEQRPQLQHGRNLKSTLECCFPRAVQCFIEHMQHILSCP
jgi:hypothetical protein